MVVSSAKIFHKFGCLHNKNHLKLRARKEKCFIQQIVEKFLRLYTITRNDEHEYAHRYIIDNNDIVNEHVWPMLLLFAHSDGKTENYRSQRLIFNVRERCKYQRCGML